MHPNRSSQFKRTRKALIIYATRSHQMPVGNLRTAANNDQDDDPRALRPIPIATKDMVSFVEKNNTAGQNAEVVSVLSIVFPQRLDLIVSRTMMMRRRAHFFWFCSSLRLSENRIKREREKCALRTSSHLSSSHLFLSLARASFLVNRSDLNRWSRCFVL